MGPKGRQERHKRSSRAARSVAPVAPIQIGAIWVHDFVCALQMLSAPRLPTISRFADAEHPKVAQELKLGPESRQEYGINGTNPD